MKIRFLISLIIIFIFSTSVSAARSTDKVMVTVNGVKVTERQVESLLGQELKMAMDFGKVPDEIMVHNLRVRAIDEIVERILIEQHAKVKGVEITKEQLDQKIAQIAFDEGMTVDEFIFKALPMNNTNLADFKERVVVGMKFDKLLELEAGKGAFIVTDEQAKRYYTANMQRFDEPRRVRASHIMINYPSAGKKDKADVVEAMEIIRKMATTGTDFAMLAKKFSEDKSTAKKGGDLGFFTEQIMPPAISKVAFSMKPGQVSEVIKMEYGCHLLKVVEVDTGGITPFEEIKKDIKRWIRDERKMLQSRGFMESLIAKAKIKWAGGKKPEPIKYQR